MDALRVVISKKRFGRSLRISVYVVAAWERSARASSCVCAPNVTWDSCVCMCMCVYIGVYVWSLFGRGARGRRRVCVHRHEILVYVCAYIGVCVCVWLLLGRGARGLQSECVCVSFLVSV
jgi:hypothetical protein